MRSLRGDVTESGCRNPELNVFYCISNGGEFNMRQPRPGDEEQQKNAWGELGEEAQKRFMRRDVDPKIYDMSLRCNRSVYKGKLPGWMPLSMEVDGEVVGLADIRFERGNSNFIRAYKIDMYDTACNASIGVIPKYQGMGIGSCYSVVTDVIGRHFKMDWIAGSTYQNDGMFNIRKRDNWEVISTSNGMVHHRKRL